jgi:hypothetical protein
MSHSTYTHRRRVDSRLLVVGSQTASLTPSPSFAHNLCYSLTPGLSFAHNLCCSLTPGLSFAHNLCCGCPNGLCEVIFDIYDSRPFQRYKKHLKVRCFDPCNRVLSFQESRRTFKSPFRECECHPHTLSKWGCDRKGHWGVKPIP